MFQRLSDVLRPCDPDDRDSGLSLIEVIVSLLVFAVLITGAVVAVSTSLRLTSDNRGREVAANLAASEIDLARSVTATQLGNRDFSTDPIDGVTYTVRRDVTWATSGGVDSQCVTGSLSQGSLFYKRVAVSVTWTGMRSADHPVRADTVVAPDGAITDSATGTILVSVKDAAAKGVRGVTVTVEPDASVARNTAKALGPDSRPGTTDVNGCAFATTVTPGAYTVTLSRADGSVYVSPDNETAPSKAAAPTAGGTSNVDFSYAPADRYELAWPAGAVRSADQRTTFVSGSTVSTVSGPVDVQHLYPRPSGYQIYAGGLVPGSPTAATSCLSPDPASWSRAADGRTGKPAPSLAPDRRVGSVVPGIVVPAQAFTVPLPNGHVVVRATTAAAPAGSGDPGCRAGTTMTYTVPAGSRTATIALPPGSWSFTSGPTASSLRGMSVPVTTIDPRTAP